MLDGELKMKRGNGKQELLSEEAEERGVEEEALGEGTVLVARDMLPVVRAQEQVEGRRKSVGLVQALGGDLVAQEDGHEV